MSRTAAQGRLALALGVPANVVALGLVSFLTDVSSETVLTILPLFLLNVLGQPLAFVGLVEGIATSAASLLRFPAGWVSDLSGRRKPLVVLGYGLSALTKPLFAAAGSGWSVLALRFTDRVGKAVRNPPRDALIADSAEEGRRARAFGIHRAMDTAGAMVGVSLAALIIFAVQGNAAKLERGTFWIIALVAAVPAIAGVAVLIFGVREMVRPTSNHPGAAVGENKTPALGTLLRGDRRFPLLLAATALFTLGLGNASDAFPILRAQNLGFSPFQVVLLLIPFNLLYALGASPAGRLADRFGARRVLVLGWGAYGLVFLGFALADSTWWVIFLFAGYALYYALSEGVGRAYVAEVVPSHLRGTAYGLYHTAVGVLGLPAGLIAGLLWDVRGPGAPFLFGAACAAAAVALLLASGALGEKGGSRAR